MSKFAGKYEYSVDNKGRLNFKKLLKRVSTEDRALGNYYLLKQQTKTADKKYNFFYIFTGTAWDQFYQTKKIDEMPTIKRMKFIATLSGEATLDSAERLSLPKLFLEHINADKDIILLGDGDKIQVWSKEDYDSYISTQSAPDEDLLDIFG